MKQDLMSYSIQIGERGSKKWMNNHLFQSHFALISSFLIIEWNSYAIISRTRGGTLYTI